MRVDFEKNDNVRLRFKATVDKFGFKNGYKGPEPTILLIKIASLDNIIKTDHLWMNTTKQFENLNLQKGDVIEFDARIKPYQKGYVGYREDVYKSIELDYKLSHPSKVVKLEK